MKFAHYIKCLERDAPRQWQGKFIKYKDLKKSIKRCCLPDGSVDAELELAFFTALNQQLADTNKYFQDESGRTVASFERTVRGFHLCFCYFTFWKFGPKHYAGLADRAYWCRKYARANAVALRKILKKHDKLCGNTRGREFLQRCWCSNSAEGIGLFLHSPLLDELKAIQEVLQGKIQEMELASLARASEGHRREGDAQGEISAPTAAQVDKKDNNMDNRRFSPMAAAGHAPPPPAPPPMPLSPLNEPQIHQTSVSEVSHSSDDGLQGALEMGRYGTTSLAGSGSATSPSLKAQRAAGLAAIEESPTHMLDSSDFEWEEAREEMSGIDMHRSKSRLLRCGGDGVAAAGVPCAEGGGGPPGQFDDMHTCEDSTGIDPDAPVSSVERLSDSSPQTGTVRGGSPEGGSSGVGPALGPFRDDDLRCPICLDLMYKPVGLGCGHKFCRTCALESAGFGRVSGAFRNVITYIPPRTPCPQCRQTHVYKGAVSLKEVGALIRNRYPEQWDERRLQELQEMNRQTSSSSALPQVPPQVRWPISPYDLLYSSFDTDEPR